MSRYSAPAGAATGIAVGQIYIQGLPPLVTEAQISSHFGQIGSVKPNKKLGGEMIYIYRDTSGRCKGDATLTYEDPDAAPSAVEFFDGQQFLDSYTLKVSVASRGEATGAPPAASAPSSSSSGGGGGGYGGGGGARDSDSYGGGGSSSGGGRGGYGGGGGRGGSTSSGFADWNCSNCHNSNFARRTECNKCGTPKEGGAGGGGGGGGGYSGGGGGRGGGSSSGFADWNCSNCRNSNFARRTECNKCGTPKDAGGPPAGAGSSYGGGAPPAGAYGGGAPASYGGYSGYPPVGVGAPEAPYAAYGVAALGGGGGGYGAPQAAAPVYAPPPSSSSAPSGGPVGGPPAMKEGDWACGGCGNVNWARRDSCNTCQRKKGPSEVRTGAGGGFAERQDRVSDRGASAAGEDGYDEWGRRVGGKSSSSSASTGSGGGDRRRDDYAHSSRRSRSRSRERGGYR